MLPDDVTVPVSGNTIKKNATSQYHCAQFSCKSELIKDATGGGEVCMLLRALLWHR